MEMIYIYLILGLGMLLSFLVGKWLDPFWRAKTLRNFTKKNYFIIYKVPKDRKRLTPFVVNVDKGLIQHKGSMWICSRGKIYEEKAPEKTTDLKNDNITLWREGVPVVFLSEDSLLPLDFEEMSTEIKPEEVDAVLSGWVANQTFKDAFMKNQQTMMLLAVLLSGMCLLAVGYVAYVQYNFMNDIAIGNIVIQKTTTAETTTDQPSQIIGDKIYIQGN
jgi:hypothetical protein